MHRKGWSSNKFSSLEWKDLFPSAMSKTVNGKSKKNDVCSMWPSPAQEKTAPSYALSRYRHRQTVFLHQAGSSKTSILDTSICRYKPNKSLPEKPYRGTDFHSMRKDRAKLPDGTKKIQIAHLHRDHSLLRLRANG